MADDLKRYSFIKRNQLAELLKWMPQISSLLSQIILFLQPILGTPKLYIELILTPPATINLDLM